MLNEPAHDKTYNKTCATAKTLISMRISSLIICVEVLRPSKPNGVMSSVVSLTNHTFIGQA